MTLIPCPECQREISSSATSCPHCGYPVVEPWTRRLEGAWQHGFRHAWIATVAFPLVWLAVAFTSGGLRGTPHVVGTVLPWFFVLAVWGLLGGLVAIALAALLRSRWLPGETGADPWRWSVPAQFVAVALFGLFLAMVF